VSSAAIAIIALLTASPCQEAVTLAPGDKSPCDGILVSSADALKALHCARVALPRCEIRADGAEEVCEVKLGAASQREDALLDRISAAESSLLSMVKCPECERAWWESPAIWGTSGVVVGVGVTLAILRATVMAQ
jgi:hypothetical protein